MFSFFFPHLPFLSLTSPSSLLPLSSSSYPFSLSFSLPILSPSSLSFSFLPPPFSFPPLLFLSPSSFLLLPAPPLSSHFSSPSGEAAETSTDSSSSSSGVSSALQSTSHQAQRFFGFMKDGAGNLFKNIRESSSKVIHGMSG